MAYGDNFENPDLDVQQFLMGLSKNLQSQPQLDPAQIDPDPMDLVETPMPELQDVPIPTAPTPTTSFGQKLLNALKKVQAKGPGIAQEAVKGGQDMFTELMGGSGEPSQLDYMLADQRPAYNFFSKLAQHGAKGRIGAADRKAASEKEAVDNDLKKAQAEYYRAGVPLRGAQAGKANADAEWASKRAGIEQAKIASREKISEMNNATDLQELEVARSRVDAELRRIDVLAKNAEANMMRARTDQEREIWQEEVAKLNSESNQLRAQAYDFYVRNQIRINEMNAHTTQDYVNRSTKSDTQYEVGFRTPDGRIISQEQLDAMNKLPNPAYDEQMEGLGIDEGYLGGLFGAKGGDLTPVRVPLPSSVTTTDKQSVPTGSSSISIRQSAPAEGQVSRQEIMANGLPPSLPPGRVYVRFVQDVGGKVKAGQLKDVPAADAKAYAAKGWAEEVTVAD